MTNEILKQYTDLKKECEEVRQKIEKLQNQIRKIEQEGTVIDKVSGGMGGLQSFQIEGFPYPAYSRKKTLLYARKATLSELELELLETLNQVEKFVSEIQDSHIRRIVRFRIIEGLSWDEVARRIGGNTKDSVKKAFYRFLEEE